MFHMQVPCSMSYVKIHFTKTYVPCIDATVLGMMMLQSNTRSISHLLADVRLSPRPPAVVEMRNRKTEAELQSQG